MDPWTAFLSWLETLIVPDWGGVIGMLPALLIVGVIGPGLTLLMLLQLHYLFTRRRGRVRLADPEPTRAELDENGTPIFPANVPFCARHVVIYPPNVRSCGIDGEELLVRCPVDATTRPADQELCRACGTRYVLGASKTAVAIRRTGRPPQGGAAVA